MNAIAISSSNLLRYAHSVALGGRDIPPIKWKANVGGLDLSDAKKVRVLEDKNKRLKKMYAEKSMQNDLLKEALGK